MIPMHSALAPERELERLLQMDRKMLGERQAPGQRQMLNMDHEMLARHVQVSVAVQG
jgi:hypothetical protein